jgi:hypothetical protein
MPATTSLHDMAWLMERAKYVWTQNMICDMYVDSPHTLYFDVDEA